MSLTNFFRGISFLENTIDKVTPKVSFETFMESVGDTIDSEIRKNETNGMNFLGGKASFSFTRSESILIKVTVFYMKKDGTYSKCENTGEYPLYLLKEEAEEELQELMDETGKYVVEIDRPEDKED